MQSIIDFSANAYERLNVLSRHSNNMFNKP